MPPDPSLGAALIERSDRKEMSITGNLRTLEFAELLQWLAQGQKTGALVIQNGKTEKRIYFDAGKIISSESNNAEEHLGSFMVREGLIDEATLSRAVKLQESTQILLGKVLVSLGTITEEELHQILRKKTQESLYELFKWTEGDFRFIPDHLPRLPMVPLEIDVTNVVLEGAKRFRTRPGVDANLGTGDYGNEIEEVPELRDFFRASKSAQPKSPLTARHPASPKRFPFPTPPKRRRRNSPRQKSAGTTRDRQRRPPRPLWWLLRRHWRPSQSASSHISSCGPIRPPVPPIVPASKLRHPSSVPNPLMNRSCIEDSSHRLKATMWCRHQRSPSPQGPRGQHRSRTSKSRLGTRPSWLPSSSSWSKLKLRRPNGTTRWIGLPSSRSRWHSLESSPWTSPRLPQLQSSGGEPTLSAGGDEAPPLGSPLPATGADRDAGSDFATEMVELTPDPIIPEAETTTLPTEAPVETTAAREESQPPQITQPTLLTRPKPRYPATAMRLRKEAVVTLRLLVDPTGKVADVERVGPEAGLGFDKAAINAALRTTWQPGTRGR